MNFCLHREKHEKNPQYRMDIESEMYYTEKIFREKQYTSRKYSFHEMKLVIFFNYDEYRMIGKTKHA